MGLAASQARALLLVARKSDLEYRQQCLTQRKMVLAQQTEQIAKDYSTKISNRVLKFTFNLNANDGSDINEVLDYTSLMAYNPDFVGQYRVTDSRGNVVVSSVDEIPKTEKYIPVYTLVNTNADGSISKVTDSKEIYSEADTSKLGTSTTLYALGDDGEYVKIQDNDGEEIADAKIKVKTTDGYADENVFSGKDEDGKLILSDKIKTLYTKGAQLINRTTTDPDISSLTDGQSYTQTGYQKVYEEPVQQSDGYYYSADGKRYVVWSQIRNTEYFQNGLRTGAFLLQQGTTSEIKNANGVAVGETTSWETTPWQGSSVIKDEYNTADDALAESEYEAKLATIKIQDQMMDMEIRQIETQHKAIMEEWDSVKKVIEDNITKTFKVFG